MLNIYEIAVQKGAEITYELGGGESINGSEFERLGLPFFAGCQRCQASLGPLQSYPTKTGMIGCRDCTDEDMGFVTADEFDAFCETGQPE